MNKYKIYIQNIKLNIKQKYICFSNQTILEAAESFNIILPYSCKIGLCTTCTAKIIYGKTRQINTNLFLNKEIKKNYILTCISYPKTNLKILTHQENNLLIT